MLTSQYAMPSFVIIGEKMVEAPADEETGEVPVDGEGAPQMVPEHFFHKAPHSRAAHAHRSHALGSMT